MNVFGFRQSSEWNRAIPGETDPPGYARCIAEVKRQSRTGTIMIDSEVEVRKGRISDNNQIIAMVERYWAFEGIAGFDRAAVGRQLERVLDDERLGNIIVASNGGTLIGYLITVYVFSLEHLGLTAEIDEFYVKPECRSRGAGSLMLAAAERFASDAGCTNLSLQLGKANQAARRLYQQHGFSPRPGYDLLEKDLGGH